MGPSTGATLPMNGKFRQKVNISIQEVENGFTVSYFSKEKREFITLVTQEPEKVSVIVDEALGLHEGIEEEAEKGSEYN